MHIQMQFFISISHIYIKLRGMFEQKVMHEIMQCCSISGRTLNDLDRSEYNVTTAV